METYLDLAESVATFHNDRYETTFAGVAMRKTNEDLQRFGRIIKASRPDVVLELGTKWGGSALWFASRVPHVVTIDITAKPSLKAREISEHQFEDRITWVTAECINHPWIPHFVLQNLRVFQPRVMVVLDCDHHAKHVQKEIEAFGPLVSPGCYLVIEDGIFDLMGNAGRRGGRHIPETGGPLLAIQENLASGQRSFERVLEVEQMYPVTHNPAGWWRRV